MAGYLKERVIWLLDVCWPFPLGVIASGLVLLLAAGIWLATRTPRPGPPARSLVSPGTSQVPAQVASTPSQPAPGPGSAEPSRSADRMPTSGMTPAAEASPAAAPTKPLAAKPEAQTRPASPKLTAKQKADFTDRMTIGQFFVDRKEYPAAIKEFQAALGIDPASREAQAAIRKAREASLQ